jgi:cellulose biosynthesis protein BcsQ
VKIVAIYNIKGGVGKTTTAVNIACLLAKQNLSVLVWDLDPQGGTSYFFNKANKNDYGFLKLFGDYISIYDVIEPADTYHIDIISNDSKFSEQFINSASHLTRVHFLNNDAIKNVLHKVHDDYDVCIIDCPPGKFSVHDNVFNCADLVLVPNIPAALSMYCNDVLTKATQKLKNEKLKVLSFFNMMQSRKNLHKFYVNEMSNKDFIQPLSSYIPFYTEIENITHNKESIFHQLKNSKSIVYYENLWDEVCDKMNWLEFKQYRGRVIEFISPVTHSPVTTLLEQAL